MATSSSPSGNDGQFRKFAEVAGQPQWADDPRFATNKVRVANRAVLIPLIRQATVFKTTAEWVARLEQAGVPCGPINDLAQMFAGSSGQGAWVGDRAAACSGRDGASGGESDSSV